MKTFEFFFEDFRDGNVAPDGFIVYVMTNLRSQLYNPGDAIIEFNEEVEDMVFIQSGTCNLYG